jgi:hypothetical protein
MMSCKQEQSRSTSLSTEFTKVETVTTDGVPSRPRLPKLETIPVVCNHIINHTMLEDSSILEQRLDVKDSLHQTTQDSSTLLKLRINEETTSGKFITATINKDRPRQSGFKAETTKPKEEVKDSHVNFSAQNLYVEPNFDFPSKELFKWEVITKPEEQSLA